MGLPPVDSLSGDEGKNKPRPGPQLPAPKRRIARGFRKKTKRILISVDPLTLRRIISSRCGCHADCFDPFRSSQSLWNKWVNLRKLFRSMTKLEQDNHVRNLVCAQTLKVVSECHMQALLV